MLCLTTQDVKEVAMKITVESKEEKLGRLAELQLRIVWEEMLKRFEAIEVTGEPKRVYSSFIRGYETLPVRIVD
jgi:hypothetical protein